MSLIEQTYGLPCIMCYFFSRFDRIPWWNTFKVYYFFCSAASMKNENWFKPWNMKKNSFQQSHQKRRRQTFKKELRDDYYSHYENGLVTSSWTVPHINWFRDNLCTSSWNVIRNHRNDSILFVCCFCFTSFLIVYLCKSFCVFIFELTQ